MTDAGWSKQGEGEVEARLKERTEGEGDQKKTVRKPSWAKRRARIEEYKKGMQPMENLGHKGKHT